MENSIIDSTCKVCSSKAIQHYKNGDTELCRCTACGVSFLTAIPTEVQLDQYYTQGYSLKKTDNNYENEVRRIFRLPEQIKLVRDLLKFFPAPATLLDIGCDRGFFLDEARRYGYTVLGVEPSNIGREYCTGIGLKTYQNIDQVQDKSDVITLWHTLEHVKEPADFMKKIHEYLNEGGVTAIRVPDYGSFQSKLFGKRWIWFQPENHYFHYTQKSLQTLLEKTGFTVLSITSQKPNDRLTKKSYSLAVSIFKKYFQIFIPAKKKAGRLYEDFTGVELYVIAEKRSAV